MRTLEHDNIIKLLDSFETPKEVLCHFIVCFTLDLFLFWVCIFSTVNFNIMLLILQWNPSKFICYGIGICIK